MAMYMVVVALHGRRNYYFGSIVYTNVCNIQDALIQTCCLATLIHYINTCNSMTDTHSAGDLHQHPSIQYMVNPVICPVS